MECKGLLVCLINGGHGTGYRLQMDMVKGKLDDISRPPSMSQSRPGSCISSSFQAERPKTFSAVGCLEVLTPETCFSEPQKLTSRDEQESFKAQSAESSLEDQGSQSSTVITLSSEKTKVNKNLSSKESDESVDPSQLAVGTEHNIDPRLEKAIKKMKALDEILLKRTAKEREVIAQSNTIRKQLWEELQSVSKNSKSRSHEENVNTNTFLALIPLMNTTAGQSSDFEKAFPSVFSTQIPCDEDEPKALQDKMSGIETSDVKNVDEKILQRAMQKKYKDHRRGVDFIQRNIELVKEAGSHVLFMDDEKLRLEQLLADIEDGCSDDIVPTDISIWLVPGEGYTPEPGEFTQLAKIEAQLQMFCRSTETNDYGVSTIPLKLEVSIDKFGDSVPAPGEKMLRYTKEVREQKIRLKEIDQQLDHIERSSSTPLSIPCCSSMLIE